MDSSKLQPVNLQGQYFIEASGGRIVTALSDLVECARDFAASAEEDRTPDQAERS